VVGLATLGILALLFAMFYLPAENGRSDAAYEALTHASGPASVKLTLALHGCAGTAAIAEESAVLEPEGSSRVS